MGNELQNFFVELVELGVVILGHGSGFISSLMKALFVVCYFISDPPSHWYDNSFMPSW